MKKILAIDQGEHLGGAEIFLSETLAALSKGACGSGPGSRAYEVHLLTSGSGKYPEMYKGSGIRIHHADLPQLKPFSLKTLMRFRKAAAALAKKMDEIAPALVVSNTVRTHILSSAAAHRLQIPLLWFAHDITFPKALLKRFIRFPKAIICCSEFVRGYYAAALPRRSSSKPSPGFEVVYPFGISKKEVEDLAAVAPDKFNADEPRVVGMVGNFIPWKGQDLFIKMASAVHARHPETRFEIIGRTYEGNPESQKYRAECEDLAASLIAKKVLTIRESVPSAIGEMAKWQILVHCSREPEPLGRVILEGMAAGCAVIASNLGGPREIIKDGRDGIIISPEANILTTAVTGLLADPKKAQILALNAQAKILSDFTRGKVQEQIGSIVARLADG